MNRGGLVVRSRIRGRRVPGSKPDSTEGPLCVWACFVLNNTPWVKRLPACEVRKFGGEVTAQAENYEVRLKIPLVDVNITELNPVDLLGSDLHDLIHHPWLNHYQRLKGNLHEQANAD
ncbi:hypothetical protein AVEN_62795-1 [Araneus ventricosus]|uniref:Uncharacterized protein n=1 Tax=Araneus ventricosus TaxID=182803 RepID=A0A4Y2MI81_ARAVE|nr:hypothetical protein AVEN_62795-1 [Araneus ventricosus]